MYSTLSVLLKNKRWALRFPDIRWHNLASLPCKEQANGSGQAKDIDDVRVRKSCNRYQPESWEDVTSDYDDEIQRHEKLSHKLAKRVNFKNKKVSLDSFGAYGAVCSHPFSTSSGFR